MSFIMKDKLRPLESNTFTQWSGVFLCRVYIFQSGCLLQPWRWALCYSSCFSGFAGVSVVLTPAAATSAVGAAPTHAAAPDIVGIKKKMFKIQTCHKRKCFMWYLNVFCFFFIVYEAGKGIKTRTATPQTPAYPPYFVTGVPTMLPIAPPSLVDKISSVPPSEGTMLSTGEVLVCKRQ